MELLKRIEELKREILNNPSDSFDIILNNIPKYTMYGYIRECNKNNLDRYALRFGRKRYTYGEFIESIDNDNIVIEYSILPTIYNLTLFIDKVAILSIVDLLLGGNGNIEDKDREPTNIDIELVKYLFSNLLTRMYMPIQHDRIQINKV